VSSPSGCRSSGERVGTIIIRTPCVRNRVSAGSPRRRGLSIVRVDFFFIWQRSRLSLTLSLLLFESQTPCWFAIRGELSRWPSGNNRLRAVFCFARSSSSASSPSGCLIIFFIYLFGVILFRRSLCFTPETLRLHIYMM